MAHFSKFLPVATLTCSLASLFKAYLTAELSLERKTKLENWDYFICWLNASSSFASFLIPDDDDDDNMCVCVCVCVS